jgi:hypothetical protein
VIDNFFRCDDPAYFAAGNLLRPVEHSGVAAGEGSRAAAAILRALRGDLPPAERAIPVSAGGAIRYVYPQRVVPDGGRIRFYGRARAAHRGRLSIVADGQVLSERPISVLPERRISLSIDAASIAGRSAVTVLLD